MLIGKWKPTTHNEQEAKKRIPFDPIYIFFNPKSLKHSHVQTIHTSMTPVGFLLLRLTIHLGRRKQLFNSEIT